MHAFLEIAIGQAGQGLDILLTLLGLLRVCYLSSLGCEKN
jgi:hypothetical protein